MDANETANLLAKHFIARTDVKAEQHASGAYTPVREKWSRADLVSHLEERRTFGHYLISSDNQCKLFCLDIDLTKQGTWLTSEDDIPVEGNPREEWSTNGPGKPWLISQLRCLAEGLALRIERTMSLPTAISYSGNKGFHVYGFTGLVDAALARRLAVRSLVDFGCFEPSKGKNFYKHIDQAPTSGYPSLEIEVFPKQESLEGKDKQLGNLLRLPLGVNRKSGQSGFFVDTKCGYDVLRPMDTQKALACAN